MDLVRTVARPLLAGMFVYGGRDSFGHPQTKVARAESVVTPIVDTLGLPHETQTWIRVNGAVQVVAGTALALGRWPRAAALALAASLVPTTLAGHSFWDEEDATARGAQRIQFLKNLSMLGGLLLVVGDGGHCPPATGAS